MREGGILKKIVEAIKDIVSNVNIDAGPNGISMQAMDPSHVALVNLNLKAEGFGDYRADKTFPLGIKLANLNKILKCASNDDIITLECEDEPSQLTLKFENNIQSASFSLNLISLDSEQLQIPETTYSSRITMPTSDFSNICKQLHQLSESVTIKTTHKSIVFSVSGDIGSGSLERTNNPSDNVNQKTVIDVDEGVTNMFSLSILNYFNKAASLSDQVNLSLSENTPLVVEYKIHQFGNLKFYLAPKLTEE
jgi:proliferating cell nuclear antigen